jgi:uncharacterized repeat protein (TIGR04076 family)
VVSAWLKRRLPMRVIRRRDGQCGSGQSFSIYSLSAILPLLPAKQRVTHPNDWMTSDAEVACPDPHCPSRLRITRIGKRHFSHADTTAVPLPEGSAP